MIETRMIETRMTGARTIGAREPCGPLSVRFSSEDLVPGSFRDSREARVLTPLFPGMLALRVAWGVDRLAVSANSCRLGGLGPTFAAHAREEGGSAPTLRLLGLVGFVRFAPTIRCVGWFRLVTWTRVGAPLVGRDLHLGTVTFVGIEVA